METKFKIPKIPLLTIPDTPLMASSQEHLPISDICEDIVLYKDGGAAVLMESTSLNFSLLSEKEQEAVKKRLLERIKRGYNLGVWKNGFNRDALHERH